MSNADSGLASELRHEVRVGELFARLPNGERVLDRADRQYEHEATDGGGERHEGRVQHEFREVREHFDLPSFQRGRCQFDCYIIAQLKHFVQYGGYDCCLRSTKIAPVRGAICRMGGRNLVAGYAATGWMSCAWNAACSFGRSNPRISSPATSVTGTPR